MSGCQRGSPIILSWPLFYDSDDNINKVEVFEIRNLKNKLKVRRQIPLCANFEKNQNSQLLKSALNNDSLPITKKGQKYDFSQDFVLIG